MLDGPDGAGKSTQARILSEHLEQRGKKVLLLREPGGTRAGEAIRKILLEQREGGDHLSALAETFLFQAARAQLIEEVVKPALAAGTWVICDRFSLSTLVYQGLAGGVDTGVIEKLTSIATAGVKPDRYLVVWVPTNVGVERRADRAADRMESKGDVFLRAVADSFRKAAKREPKKYRLIDGQGSLDDVRERIWSEVEPLFAGHTGSQRQAALGTRGQASSGTRRGTGSK